MKGALGNARNVKNNLFFTTAFIFILYFFWGKTHENRKKYDGDNYLVSKKGCLNVQFSATS